MPQGSEKPMVEGIPFGTHCEHVDGDLKVQIEWIGEGISGNYNPQDPEDAPILRFRVLERAPLVIDTEAGDEDGWTFIEGTSHCCGLDAEISDATKAMAASFIMSEVKGKADLKGICERLAWLRLGDVLEFGQNREVAETASPGM